MDKYWREILEKTKSIAIAGGNGSGKTAFGYYLLQFSKKPIYLFKHPRPEILPKGIKLTNDFEEMQLLKDSLIWIDEPQLYMVLYEGKGNNAFSKLLSLMRQKGNTVILSTSDTRFYTRGLEAYLDTWVVLDIDYDTIKQGSKIAKIIKTNSLISPRDFRLPKGIYLLDDRRFKSYNGRRRFGLPKYWKEELGIAYRDTV